MPRPHHGDVPRVISRRLLLLVRRVVLLVDDDEAETLDRREHGGARADDDIHQAAADALPLIVALPVGEPAVLAGPALA
jgi:hypothetical protein